MAEILTDEQEKDIGILKIAFRELMRSIVALMIIVPTMWMFVNGMALYDAQATAFTAIVTFYIIKQAQGN